MQSPSAEFFDDRDDVDLLTRARSGDTRCADVLWIRVRPAVLAVARGIADNKHDAEDLASEAMTKVFAAIADGQGPSESVLPYLYATMRNLHISTLRRQARVGVPLELDEQRVLNLVTVEPDADESELVTQAFRALPDRWRHVLWASLVEGRPGQDIADELSIKPAAVHALKSRALEGLRQQYLSEHAKRSEERECAAVHRVLASIARGRTRRSTDLNQVWRHLRGCEHCAEGYREITAINNRIGALLGPAAAASLIGFLPHAATATLGVIKAPAAISKLVAAAGVAGVIAIAGTTLSLAPHHDSTAPESARVAPATSPPVVAPPATPARSAKSRNRPAATVPPAAPTPTCSPSDLEALTDLTALDQLGESLPTDLVPGVPTPDLVPNGCESDGSTPPGTASTIAGVSPTETLAKVPALLEDLPELVQVPLVSRLPALPVVPLPGAALLQP